ncbi:hypothetical protein DVH24_039045 [Malus domestica]|uniref:Uncharacterized protein n=1 Tax=Malus domestica TaxID=3750 RepID=A0A498KBF7_MALDO|nr:hypothetical protein DVH24_039045 [Malus domestica]
MSNPLIPNLILSREPTPPTKYPHLRYTYFVYWHTTVIQHARYTLPLHPSRLYSIYSVFDRLRRRPLDSNASLQRRANTRCTWFTQIGYVYGVDEFSIIVKGLHQYIGSSSPLVGTSE